MGDTGTASFQKKVLQKKMEKVFTLAEQLEVVQKDIKLLQDVLKMEFREVLQMAGETSIQMAVRLLRTQKDRIEFLEHETPAPWALP